MPKQSRRGLRPFAATTAVVLAGVIGLAGCSSNSGEAEPSPDATESAAPSPQAPAEGQIDAVPELAEGWVGIRSDVTVNACPTEAGDVTATGTVVNSAAEPRDLVVVVSWNAPGSTDPLLQLAWSAEQVPAGETRDWSVSGALPSAAGQCVVLARSGSLATQ